MLTRFCDYLGYLQFHLRNLIFLGSLFNFWEIFLNFVFSRTNIGGNSLNDLFLTTDRHKFYVKTWRSHNGKTMKWIICHHNKTFTASIKMETCMENFPLIVTKYCKVRLQPLQPKFVFLRQNMRSFSCCMQEPHSSLWTPAPILWWPNSPSCSPTQFCCFL